MKYSRRTDRALRRLSRRAPSVALYVMAWVCASIQSSSEESQRTLSLLALNSWGISLIFDSLGNLNSLGAVTPFFYELAATGARRGSIEINALGHFDHL